MNWISLSVLIGVMGFAIDGRGALISGEQLFLEKCASCHGAQGEGAEEHEGKLEGDLSALQLAGLIADTMPEDDPGSLSESEYQAIAEYMHGAFYSTIARARTQKPRIELARLTVAQYRQTLADLLNDPKPLSELEGDRYSRSIGWERIHVSAKMFEIDADDRGLRGDYFNSRRPGGGTHWKAGDVEPPVASRIDPEIGFDFGTSVPMPEIEEVRTFSIRWTGSLLASKTGEYEFVIRSDHGARLWVNDTKHVLIDAWLNGTDTEHRESLYLLEGRAYPLKLEFTRSIQGVPDEERQDKIPPPKPASIALLWRQPDGELQPIPSRHLVPRPSRSVFVCDTPFPPDDRSYGWVRGTAVSKAWDQATTRGALDAAAYVTAQFEELAETSSDPEDHLKKLRAFGRRFVTRAFRRPLSDPLLTVYVDRQLEKAADPETAIKRIVLLALKSPRFLFRELGNQSDQYDVATRLSYGLWNSIPDQVLIQAAAKGQLATRDQVAAHAERMLNDLRARAKLREFLLTWLDADSSATLTKDPVKFAGFDTSTIDALKTSLELLLDDVLWSETSDYRKLLLSDVVFLNQALGKLYGVEAEMSDGFQKVSLDSDHRAGVLTHPYIMARFARDRESSPIHRGVFLARGLLGQVLRPPPVAASPLPPDLAPGLTTRERVTHQTKAASCMTCHGIINPLGFTLERFDAVGRLRDKDRGKPIDDSVVYRTRNGQKISLKGARALGDFLANSKEAHLAFTEKLFHHLVQQSVQAYGERAGEQLCSSFEKGDFNIRRLAVEIMVESALFATKTTEPSILAQ